MQKTKRKFQTRQLVFAALCVAIGLALPQALHMIPNAGGVFLPMHIPVLLSGFLCGGPLGLLVGLVTPLVSSLLTGMPPAALLPSMMCELAVYGLVAGVLYRHLRTKSAAAGIYISLVGAMLAGRIVSGLVRALIFNTGEYSLQIWVTGAFVTALPGVIIQLVLLPALIGILQKHGYTAAAQPPAQDPLVARALGIIHGGGVSCVVAQNGQIIHEADGRGVSPLLRLYDNDPGKLSGALIVDKVIGKAAAMILVLGGAKQVYGETMSRAGEDYLRQHGIATGHGRCVDVIRNRTRDGICPIEKSVLEIEDPHQGLDVIRQTIQELMRAAG